MPGGLGRSRGFYSDLNGGCRGCRNLSRCEMEGVVCVCVFSLVFFFWKIVCCLCTLAHRGERFEEATMSYNL